LVQRPVPDASSKQCELGGQSARTLASRAAASGPRAALDHIERGQPGPATNQTFAAFARFWRVEIVPGEGLAPSTVRWYDDLLSNYVLPAIGPRASCG
jgi:hypothetical protein